MTISSADASESGYELSMILLKKWRSSKRVKFDVSLLQHHPITQATKNRYLYRYHQRMGMRRRVMGMGGGSNVVVSYSRVQMGVKKIEWKSSAN